MDELEIDPAIAAAMGFSSFGGKRRKHNPRDDDAFVDISDDRSEKLTTASTGANNVALGRRSTASGTLGQQVQEQGATGTEPTTMSNPTEEMEEKSTAVNDPSSNEGDHWTPGYPPPQELATLRRGIQNARGDMVVFLPSFIEDPWKGLG